MNKINFEIIILDLRRYSTVDELKTIIEENNLKIDPEKISQISSKYSKVFIDKISNELFAVIYKGTNEVIISKQCEDSLLKLESLKLPEMKKNLTLDSILDKISEKGFKSLTAHEKLFLKKNS